MPQATGDCSSDGWRVVRNMGYRARTMTKHGMPVDSHSGRIQPGEARAVAVSALYFFCVLAAYYVIRPVRDQLSAAVGSTQLPRFYAATFLATLALTPVFAWLATRYPRRLVVLAVYGFFIACLLAFVPLFSTQALLGGHVMAQSDATGWGKFVDAGVPVIEWSPGRPLLGAIEEVTAFRRRMRYVSASR